MKNQSVFNPTLDLDGTFYCNNLSGQFFKYQGDSLSLHYTLPDSLKTSNILFDFDNQNQMIISAKNIFELNKYRAPELRMMFSSNQTEISKDADGGLILFDSRTKEIKRLYNGELSKPNFADTTGLTISQLTAYAQFRQEKERMLLLNSFEGDYYSYNNNKWTNLNPKTSEQDRPISLGILNQKGVWIAYQNKGCRSYDIHGNERYNGQVLFPDYQLSTAMIDEENNVWLGTIGKGILIIPDLKAVDFNNISSIQKDDIKSITSDGENSVYLSGFQGKIYRFQGLEYEEIHQHYHKVEFIHYLKENNSLLFNNHHGKLDDNKLESIEKYFTSSIKDLYSLSSSEFLIASNMGAYLYSLAPYDSTYANQFKGYESFGRSSNANILSFEVGRCHAISYDSLNKEVWIGTINGLVVINENTQENIEYKGKILGVIDIEILEDEVWVATTKSGILVFNDKKISRVISAGNGLPSSNIICMKKYGDRLIISTDKGLQIKNLETGFDTYLNKTNSLRSNRVLDLELVDGYLWLVFSDGVQRIPLNELSYNSHSSNIYIEEITVNEEQFDPANESEFEYDQNKFEFRFVALAFKHRGELQYEYRLNGFEESWNRTGFESNSAKYSALPSGKYEFEARAINENGVRSNSATFTFSISPPFWTRWWFILLCAFALVSIVAIYFMIRISIIRKRLVLEKQIKASEVTAIKAQMNPHFVFNALNSVQDLILQNDIRESNIYLGKFADLMRKTLDYSSRDFITLEEEINLLKIYLDLEKLRFVDDFKVVYEIDLDENETDHISIPSMVIQPYVENALKHGLLHKAGEKILNIKFQRKKDTLLVEVKDNGIGRKRSTEIQERREKTHHSFASDAIQKRIDLVNEMQEEKIILEVIDLAENGLASGTIVQIKFPLKK